MTELETERLLLRPMTEADLDWYAALRGDAHVMRYIGSAGSTTRERSRERLERLVSCWAEHGLGMFSVKLRAESTPIGWAGLQPLDGSSDIEIGYGFGRAAWGRGFATEAARAILRWGFAVCALHRIVAVAYPDNDASHRVMEKLGMRYEGMRLVYGVDSVCYSVTADDFASNTSPRGGRS